MSLRNRFHRFAPALALAVLAGALAAPAQARPAAPHRAAAEESRFSPFAAFWSYLSDFWQAGAAAHGFRNAIGAEGASLDPHGGTGTGAPVGGGAPQVQNGGSL